MFQALPNDGVLVGYSGLIAIRDSAAQNILRSAYVPEFSKSSVEKNEIPTYLALHVSL